MAYRFANIVDICKKLSMSERRRLWDFILYVGTEPEVWEANDWHGRRMPEELWEIPVPSRPRRTKSHAGTQTTEVVITTDAATTRDAANTIDVAVATEAAKTTDVATTTDVVTTTDGGCQTEPFGLEEALEDLAIDEEDQITGYDIVPGDMPEHTVPTTAVVAFDYDVTDMIDDELGDGSRRMCEGFNSI